MSSRTRQDRMQQSAEDFWNDIRPLLEPRLKATIHPLELLQRNELVDAFDQVGIDAFTVNRGGDLQGLSSRMRYTKSLLKYPAEFSFRFSKWDCRVERWDDIGEYKRKLYAVKNPDEAIMYPYYHVESFKYGGEVQWSYIARTADLMRYIEKNIDDRKKVKIWSPRDKKEVRKVVSVYIEPFMQEHECSAVVEMVLAD